MRRTHAQNNMRLARAPALLLRARLPAALGGVLLSTRLLATAASEPAVVARAAVGAAGSPPPPPPPPPPADERGLRSLTLYVYASCPFCNKVIQYCNASRIPFTMVEVDPLFKHQIAWAADWGKVPVAVVNGRRVVDSDRIIDHLEALLARGAAADAAAAAAATGGAAAAGGGAAYLTGLRPLGTGSAAEREQRAWVDRWLVRTLSPNIYRTLGEAWEAFDYLTERNFSATTRLPAQVVGTLAMWALSGRLKRKHGIVDERRALVDALGEWTAAVAAQQAQPQQQQQQPQLGAAAAAVAPPRGGGAFHGGSSPDLADCAVYGVLQGIRTTATERDVFAALPALAPWYAAMAEATGTAPVAEAAGAGAQPRPGAAAALGRRRGEGTLEHRVTEAPLRG